jgi:uncharacterized membrane protein YphA (DoxX/SURF4 family)
VWQAYCNQAERSSAAITFFAEKLPTWHFRAASIRSGDDMSTSKILAVLRFTLGATAFVAGADKFTNLLTDWEQYLAPLAAENIPISERQFMRLVGVIEMGVGALILSGRTRVGGYIASAWLLAIAANLIATGEYFDIAARDVNMAAAAFALAELSRAARSRRSFTLGEEPQHLEPAA